MLILTLRSDRPDAEIGIYDDMTQLSYKVWPAHRQLAETLLQTIEEELAAQNKGWKDIAGIVCYQGPGSFTGLRIGLTVVSTLGYSLGVPLVAMQDPAWLETGITRLLAGESDKVALPFYGADVHTTQQKK